MQDRNHYEAMAQRAHHAFCTRLNWRSAVEEMQALLRKM
jgi:hypothetical protein